MSKISDKMKKLNYRVFFSQEDNQCVAVVDEFEFMSWIDTCPVKALEGLIKIVASEMKRGMKLDEKENK